MEVSHLLIDISWIVIPIVLLVFTNLHIWQIIIILIIYAMALNLLNPLGFNEGFQTQCPTDNCNNPFLVQRLIQIQEGPSSQNTPKATTIRPIAQIPLTPEQEAQIKNLQQKEKEKEIASVQPPAPPKPVALPPQKPVNVTQVSTEPAKISVCQALTKAGFDPKWTYDNVHKLLDTADGQKQMKKINDDVIKMTGSKQLTNQDIVNCYPQYISEYICKKTDDSPANVDKLQKQIENQQKEITKLTQMVTNKNNSSSRSPVDINLENRIMNETGDNLTPNLINSHCNLNDINNSIRLEVEKYYDDAFNTIKNQKPALPAPQLDQIKMQYTNLADIIQNKAILEFRQLINLYQNRNQDQWKQDLLLRKTYSVRGHQVPGTDFYIPWAIFDKNISCFGIVASSPQSTSNAPSS